MRRKSPRTAAAAATKTTPEKTKSPTRKSRRSSRRKKQQSSESSDDSQDEQSLQAIVNKQQLQQQATTESAETAKQDDNSSEAVWKVTTSDSSSTGEIQKIKISLTRPCPSTPERTTRRTRRKSGGAATDDRNDESSTTQEDDVEERDEKRGKGKSNKGTKLKSKIEQKTTHPSHPGQCEISENNVQVTAQSPPPPIDILPLLLLPVDNVSDTVETTEHSDSSAQNRDVAVVHLQQTIEDDTQPSTTPPPPPPPQINDDVTQQTIETKEESAVAASTATENANVNAETGETANVDATVAEEPKQVVTEVVEEEEEKTAVVADEEEEKKVVEEVAKEGNADDGENAKEEPVKVVEEVVAESEENVSLNSRVEETEKSSQEECHESLPSQIETTTTESFVEYMEVDVSENEHFRNIAEEIVEEQKKPEETTKQEQPQQQQEQEQPPRKRKWGHNQALQKYFPNIFKVDVDTIKSICEELTFLEESEVKLETTPPEERRKSIEQKPKKTERKVSMEEIPKVELETTTTTTTTNSEDLNNFETNANIIAMNRKISIVDDTASKLKPPPSPAKNPIAEVLFITNLVRPFTIKQLKELLERTGKLKENGFWTDHIKSKCYVQYESPEEAEATRNALHGVQWPIGNGKKLIIEYATVEEMEKAKNPPPQTPPVATETKAPEKEVETPAVKQQKEEPEEKSDDRREKRRKETHTREWDIGKEDPERRRTRSRSRERSDNRKRHVSRRSTTPVDDFISKKQKKQEEAPPQKLMDDLFQKTKATPCIYWLPLTPEEIALKQQQRLIRMEEHKRRLEEAVRSRGGDFARGGPYRRRDFAE